METLARVVGTWPGKGSRDSFWKFNGGEHTLASGEAEGTACAKAKRRASLETVDNLEGEPAGREEGASLGGGFVWSRGWPLVSPLERWAQWERETLSRPC